MIALFNVEIGDAPEGSGADIHIRLWLDLPRAADRGNQVVTLVIPAWAWRMLIAVMPATARTITTTTMIFLVLIVSFFAADLDKVRSD